MLIRKTVMFIGSCRFLDKMKALAWEFTREGWIVMLPNERPEGAEDIDSELLESIGKAKINKSDLVYVCNFEGYIGESTSKELEYAKAINKELMYAVDPDLLT